MLPERLQEFLKDMGRLLDPNRFAASEEGGPQARVFDWAEHEVGRHQRYADFLAACGHDTRDLLGAVERLRAAAQELREVGEFYSRGFAEEPFRVLPSTFDEEPFRTVSSVYSLEATPEPVA